MFFFKASNITPVKRNFQPSYLIDKLAHQQLEEFGFVVLKNIINNDEIDEARNYFEELKKLDGYEVNNIFKSTGNFKSFDLQQKVFAFIKQLMSKTAHRYSDLDKCEIGNGGAFFIKPNSKDSQLDPHQDSTVVDEAKTYAIFVWIPLSDINEVNGPLYVLPKSHLWGNFYRSQHIPWSFRNFTKELWKQMIPIYVNKGDIILFDSSIIHGSSINHSNEYRVVVCGALLPKNHQMVDYLLEKDKVIQYHIDENYWLEGGTPDLLKKYGNNKMEYKFPNPIKKRDLSALLNHNKKQLT